MLDAMRGYLHAASGLTELTRKRAQELAQSLLAASGSSSTGAVAAQVSSVAEELVNAAKSNRAAVREMVRGEVEVAVARLGLVPATELDRAHRKIATLEATVAELARASAGTVRGGKAVSPTAAGKPQRASTPAGGRPSRAAVKRAATQAAGASSPQPTVAEAAAKKTAAKKTAPEPGKKTAAKKTPAKKTAASSRTRTPSGTGTGGETSS